MELPVLEFLLLPSLIGLLYGVVTMELASLYSSFALSPLAWYLVWLPRTYCPSTPNTADPHQQIPYSSTVHGVVCPCTLKLVPPMQSTLFLCLPLYCSSRHQHTYLHSCRDWCLHLLFSQHYSFPLVPYR